MTKINVSGDNTIDYMFDNLTYVDVQHIVRQLKGVSSEFIRAMILEFFIVISRNKRKRQKEEKELLKRERMKSLISQILAESKVHLRIKQISMENGFE
jgi:hypothetical protein